METQQGMSPESRPGGAQRGDRGEARAVREWLEEAWRHGEVVLDDEEGLVTTTPAPSIDRFHIEPDDILH